jgi:starch-binding outer membrane protein, SusD/RagB family
MSYNFSSTNIRGNPKLINSALYARIAATDVRKACFDSTGTDLRVPASGIKAKYASKKFKAAAEADSRGDVCIMRAGEMYLIEAEAHARMNQDALAQADLFTLLKNRNPSYVMTTKTGQALIDEILVQRRIELWGEGFRFLDLKRYNQALDRTGANHTTSLCRITSLAAGDNMWQWLIPKQEIDANGKMVQNEL